MKITSLRLVNYRNHKSKLINFKHANIIFGLNGSGKTSILEAITILSTSKSNRTNKIQELINWSSDNSYSELNIIENGEEKTIRLILDKNNSRSKTFSLDGKILPPKEIIGRLLTVYFGPEALDIITGNPAERRRFLDILISQVDNSYLLALIELKKTLLNRNMVLKDLSMKRKNKKEIVFWDKKLINAGSLIIKKRKKACNVLEKHLKKHHKKIVGREEKIKLVYMPSVVQSKEHQSIEETFTERLVSDFTLEIRYGNTLIGPHRDDMKFLISGKDASSYSSRGEIRSLVLALKLAEVDYIKKETEQKPIVLLDDVFSELDEKREQYIMEFISKIPQTIITTSDIKIAKNLSKKGVKLIKLNELKAYA